MIKKIPCGGFYVNDDAVEMIDGKPVLKTSGSDEVLDNAKATGGIGYTEQGEQTVITWDGDTEGLVSVNIGNTLFYKVSNNTPSVDDLIGGRVVYLNNIGELLNKDITSDNTMQSGSIITTSNVFISLEDNYTVQGITFPEKGIYFQRYVDVDNIVGHTTSLTYGTPDTIHKIDEKYLPASGGAMVVEVDYDGEQFVSTKTVDEVKNAMLTMPVIGIAKIMGEFKAVGIFSWLDESADPTFDASSPVMTVTSYTVSPDDYQQVRVETLPLIAVSDGEFVINA